MIEELKAEREARVKAEGDLGRMQNVVRDALCAAVKGAIPDANLSRIDGGGSDGDEFDFTAAEVSIACGMFEDEIEALRTRIADLERLNRALSDELDAREDEESMADAAAAGESQ